MTGATDEARDGQMTNTPQTASEILSRAQELAPVLRERAAEIEQHRRLPADVVELLRSRPGWSRRWPTATPRPPGAA